MQDIVTRKATYADLEAVPPHLVAEILRGELVTHPRPAPRHSVAAASLTEEVLGPFQKGRGGPGGWLFMAAPELRLDGNVAVPELAGGRRERIPVLPETAYVETAPDWVCEILSPSTEKYDRGAKRDIYGEAGVKHLWLLDARVEQLEVFELTGGRWLLLGTFHGSGRVRTAPFDAIEIDLEGLWPL